MSGRWTIRLHTRQRFGELMADVIVFNNHGVGQSIRLERLPQWGETVQGLGWKVEEDGGKGSNVAVALGRLGVDAAFMGKLGEDDWGRQGIGWMEAAGVDVSHVRISPEVSTCAGLVITRSDGQNAIIVGKSSSDFMTEEEICQDMDAMKGARLFITGFEIDRKKALFAARRANSLGMVTILNASPLDGAVKERLTGIDILIVNETEAGMMLEGGMGREAEHKARLLSEVYGVKTVIVTLGGKGCETWESGKETWFPPVPAEVVDTTGAGDGFLAAFAANLVWEKSFEEACANAGKYAAYTTTKKGTVAAYPHYRKYRAILSGQDGQAGEK